jgi:hypothetical protein
MRNKSTLLEIDEVILLTALLTEAGMDCLSALPRIHQACPSPDLKWIVAEFSNSPKLDVKGEGDLFIRAALSESQLATKAFFSQLAVSSLTGMTSGPNLKQMADIYRDPNFAKKISIAEKSALDETYSNLLQTINEPGKWGAAIGVTPSFRALQVIHDSLPLFENSGANIIEWVNHFRPWASSTDAV